MQLFCISSCAFKVFKDTNFQYILFVVILLHLYFTIKVKIKYSFVFYHERKKKNFSKRDIDLWITKYFNIYMLLGWGIVSNPFYCKNVTLAIGQSPLSSFAYQSLMVRQY